VSYLVLARKSRPQTFGEVVGQKAVVRTLQNGLTLNRVPHALIFSGVRGTGKTTLARIMAKALNCEQGPAAEPCNRCRSCREITEGTSIDLQEVDGASNRGIQEIRELKEKIRFMPTSSRYKIIIIDEVHMLTTEAFNALLKTLEEPPPHVYFMFATTELHKVPITILSRCQRYELKRLSHRELADHFSRLAEAEGVQVTPEGLDMIVREAGGSVRDGLSLLDQIFSYCGREVKTEDVIDVLGLVSHRLVAAMGSALLKGDLRTIYTLLDEIYLHGTDIKRFSNDLVALVPRPHCLLGEQ
jgi:DNA polymerase III subunit gamma/tau